MATASPGTTDGLWRGTFDCRNSSGHPPFTLDLEMRLSSGRGTWYAPNTSSANGETTSVKVSVNGPDDVTVVRGSIGGRSSGDTPLSGRFDGNTIRASNGSCTLALSGGGGGAPAPTTAAFDFVTKPVDLNDLEITLRKTLDDIARVRDLDGRRAAAERARSNLARYFSPNLVGILAEQDEPLGPVRREMVAVADIVGFTRMTERMEPDAVVGMLREFHEYMAAEIFACGGTIDKYIGDAILAVFGLPTAGPDDAAHALCCAGRMLAALERWNAERSARGEPELGIGIGLNYGPAVVGDVGSDQGLSFTVIGDTVNTAHRLQVLTRTLQTQLVVGHSVVARLGGGATEEAARLIGQLQDQGEQALRGRCTPVRVWTKMEQQDLRRLK